MMLYTEGLFTISDEDNDEDQNGLYYLPAAPEVDDPEEAYNPDVRIFHFQKSSLSKTCICAVELEIRWDI